MSKTIAVVSGGLDSVTMAYHLKSQGHQLHIVAVDYGQRHHKELEFARGAAARLGAPFEIAVLSSARSVMRGSALTDSAVRTAGPSSALSAYRSRTGRRLGLPSSGQPWPRSPPRFPALHRGYQAEHLIGTQAAGHRRWQLRAQPPQSPPAETGRPYRRPPQPTETLAPGGHERSRCAITLPGDTAARAVLATLSG